MERPQGYWIRVKQLNKIIESIKEYITPEPEDNPWPKTDEPKPEITEEDIEEAVKGMQEKQRKPFNPIMLGATKLSVILWVLCHLILLYMMVGSPTSGGVLVIVLVNLNFLRHYMMLLGRIKNE